MGGGGQGRNPCIEVPLSILHSAFSCRLPRDRAPEWAISCSCEKRIGGLGVVGNAKEVKLLHAGRENQYGQPGRMTAYMNSSSFAAPNFMAASLREALVVAGEGLGSGQGEATVPSPPSPGDSEHGSRAKIRVCGYPSRTPSPSPLPSPSRPLPFPLPLPLPLPLPRSRASYPLFSVFTAYRSPPRLFFKGFNIHAHHTHARTCKCT